MRGGFFDHVITKCQRETAREGSVVDVADVATNILGLVFAQGASVQHLSANSYIRTTY